LLHYEDRVLETKSHIDRIAVLYLYFDKKNLKRINMIEKGKKANTLQPFWWLPLTRCESLRWPEEGTSCSAMEDSFLLAGS